MIECLICQVKSPTKINEMLLTLVNKKDLICSTCLYPLVCPVNDESKPLECFFCKRRYTKNINVKKLIAVQ